jgi:hypothetical protein
LFGFCPPLFSGSGIFTKTFGLLPKRRPITTVFGAPIHVTKSLNPTEDEISQLHTQYTEALTKLFDEHKVKLGLPSDEQLIII